MLMRSTRSSTSGWMSMPSPFPNCAASCASRVRSLCPSLLGCRSAAGRPSRPQLKSRKCSCARPRIGPKAAEVGVAADNVEDTMDELEMLVEALGVKLERERRAAVLAAFQPIAQEIAKLRSLDLTDVHPAVVFSPLPDNQQS